ncbi:50S ribosomal protein L15 [Candidatus Roizmanbacteria bacterium]|nr:50S ribosomal protein L15 [Candidatus Roizmanbacteria bacterium]
MNAFLSQLPKTVEPKKKRVGRGAGSGKGAKSTRGTTRHQAARENIPLHFEGGQGRMVKRFPLLRGKGRNKSFVEKPEIITFTHLNMFEDGAIVDMQALLDKKLITIGSKEVSVKVLSTGKLEKKLIVVLPVSQSAKKRIEELGGEVQ